MNTKASGILELIIFLIIVVVTSALILLMVKFNVITVKTEGSSEPILNTEFIPYAREGIVVIKEFQFCGSVDEFYSCVQPDDSFNFDEQVHYRFGVETSPYNGELMLVKNYRVKGPSGEVLLDVGEQQRYQLDLQSREKTETILFKDYFIVGSGLPGGEYTLELVVENPLLTKMSTLTKRFNVGVGE